MTEWRGIRNTEVSNTGLVRSWKQPGPGWRKRAEPLLLTPAKNARGKGYLVVSISYVNGIKQQQKYVHLLVLEAFTGSSPEGTEGCHDNGNSIDNRIENLRWDYHSGNMQDAVSHDTITHGIDQHSSKMTDTMVLCVRERYAAGGVTQVELAAEFNMRQSSMRKILIGETWARVGGPLAKKMEDK